MALPLCRVFSTERARRELLTSFVNDALDMAARFSELIEEEDEDKDEDEEAAEEEEEEERDHQDEADDQDEGDGRSTDEGCAVRAQAVALVDAFLRKPFESSLGII
jgi:ABC-type Zn2+ transport system substrate-binding protein/surface adhesin